MIAAKMSLENKKDARLESSKCSQSNKNHKEDPKSNKSTKEDKGKSLVEKHVSKRTSFFNGSCYKCNKIGHRVVECRNGMNQNSNFFSSKCYAYNKYVHKSHQCRNPLIDQNRYNHYEA